jgi:hypothetical protein
MSRGERVGECNTMGYGYGGDSAKWEESGTGVHK